MHLCDWADIDPWAEGYRVYLRCKSKFSSSDIFICMSKVVWYFIVFASLDSVIVLENHPNLQSNKNGKKLVIWNFQFSTLHTLFLFRVLIDWLSVPL